MDELQGTAGIILVLLAAGSSRRFQGNKLLHEFQGKPMYRHLADQVKALPSDVFEKKMVVTQYEEIGDSLGKEGFLVVRNRRPELGISHSIHLAIAAMEEQGLLPVITACGCDYNQDTAGDACVKQEAGTDSRKREAAVCFAVCDQPFLSGKSIQRLMEGWKQSGKGLGCLCCQGELGNPAVFGQRYLDELLLLTGDTGGKKVIRRHMDDLFLLEVEDGKELMDIDVKADVMPEEEAIKG